MYSIRIMQLMWAAVINTLLFCSHSTDGSSSLSVTAGLQSFQATVYLYVFMNVYKNEGNKLGKSNSDVRHVRSLASEMYS